jgi:uroporphyrinogen-III synthase
LNKRVVVLRPEPGATVTAERAREYGLEAVVIPLFVLEPVAWHVPDPAGFDALLLTSANAVRMAGDQLSALRRLRVHAVGGATAEAARDAGFDIASVGEAGVDAVLETIVPELKLLHLCGRDRREPHAVRQAITPLVVYRATAIDAPDLTQADGAVAIVHSPRAGRRLGELVSERTSIAIAAISAAAAEAAGDGWKRITIADAPTDEALLALAAQLCNKPAPQ